MPFVSHFYGIVIYLYANDHDPPHFHAKYAGQDVAIGIETLEVITGRVPARAMRLVQEWAAMHRAELSADWELLQRGELPTTIEPLP